MRILILDDDSDRQESFLKRMFEKGWKADHAETAEEAIGFFSMNEYDLVFLDHDLSHEIYVESNREDTGAEVARRMLALWEGKKVKPGVITHSLNTSGRLNIAAILKPVTTVAQKPFLWTYKDFHATFSTTSPVSNARDLLEHIRKLAME